MIKFHSWQGWSHGDSCAWGCPSGVQHLQDSALKTLGQLLQGDNPLWPPPPWLSRDRHTAESRAGVDAFPSNDLKSSSVLVNYLGKLSPKSLYSLLLLVPAGPQTRAEGVFAHRKNFSIFSVVSFSSSLVSGGRVEGKTTEIISKGSVGPRDRICVLAALGHLSLERQELFGGDLLPVDPKLEHSMGHKISPAQHSRSSRRVNPKARQQGEPCSKCWMFTLVLPRKKRMSHNNSSPCWEVIAKLSQPLDDDQGPFDLQGCTSLS